MSRQIVITLPEWTEIKQIDNKQFADLLPAYDEMLNMIKNGTPLDKIRTEIKEKYGDYDICEWFENYDYEENDVSEYRSVGNVSDILAIIDKYIAESEENNDTNSTADI